MSKKSLLFRITQIKEELYKILNNESNLLSNDVYKLSIELDELIYKYMVTIKKIEKKNKKKN